MRKCRDGQAAERFKGNLKTDIVKKPQNQEQILRTALVHYVRLGRNKTQ